MQEDDLLLLMKTETPYLPDDGFSDKVMNALPLRRGFRMQVIGLSWLLALVCGAVFWALNHTTLPIFDLETGVLWSAATLGFWLLAGLFAFVAIDEGVFEY